MVRKHSWANQQRMTRTRPKTPAPKGGWLLTELARLTELPESTLRYYGAQKLIRPIQRRGTVTRYARHELMLLLGLARMKSDATSTLADKKRKLEAMSTVELEQWLREGPLPEQAAQALGLEIAPVRSVTSVAPDIGDFDDPSSIAWRHLQDARFEHWQRIPLLPGLDLMLRADASRAARVAAQSIYEQMSRQRDGKA